METALFLSPMIMKKIGRVDNQKQNTLVDQISRGFLSNTKLNKSFLNSLNIKRNHLKFHEVEISARFSSIFFSLFTL